MEGKGQIHRIHQQNVIGAQKLTLHYEFSQKQMVAHDWQTQHKHLPRFFFFLHTSVSQVNNIDLKGLN